MAEMETLKAQLEAANRKIEDLETRLQNLTLLFRHEFKLKKNASFKPSLKTKDKVLTSLG